MNVIVYFKSRKFNSFITNIESAAFHSYNIQVVALNTMKVSGTAALKSVMDRFVRIGVTYEKTNSHTQYQHIQKKCIHFLQDINLNMSDYKELDSYFVLCEYLAYVSRKSKSHEGTMTAYNYMMKPLENLTEFSYYQAAYAATAKLSMGSLQMDKMVAEDTCKFSSLIASPHLDSHCH